MKTINFDLLKKNIEKRAKENIEAYDLTDAVIGVYQNGNEYTGIFGDADRDSLFRLASMTKPVTAVAAGIAVSKGIFSPEDEISKYLKGFKDMPIHDSDKRGNPTIAQILSHSSGICSSEKSTAEIRFGESGKHTSLADVEAFYSNEPLDFLPGKAQFYSATVALDLICRIIEKAEDMPYEDWAKKHIFEPCRMKDTTYVPTEEQWKRTVNVSGKKDGKPFVHEEYRRCLFPGGPDRHYCGTAGLASTYDDYMNFAKMLLAGGSFDGKQIVPRSWVKEMSKKQLPPEVMPDPVVWGYGVRVITGDDYNNLPTGCYGWSGAFGSHFWVDPVNGITAVYMKNCTNDGGAGALTAWNFETDVYASIK